MKLKTLLFSSILILPQFLLSSNIILQESFENLRDVKGWHVLKGEITGDHGVVWNTDKNGLELQRDIVSDSAEGDVHAELDAHNNIKITTKIITDGSENYILSFKIKPRGKKNKDNKKDTSQMSVRLFGKTIRIKSDKIGNLTIVNKNKNVTTSQELQPNGWSKIEIVYSNVKNKSNILKIKGIGKNDSYGMLLDDIKVIGDKEEEVITPTQVISNIKLNGLDEVTIIQGEEYRERNLENYRDNEFEIIGEVDTSTIGQYILKYIVRDSGQEVSTSRIVNVVSPYSLNIRVYGNTATFGKRSTINLRLRSKPIADVKISFDSSNLNEGEIWGDKTIIFTPKNWERGQSIIIKGKNQNPIDGKQDYNITFEPIISEDSNYNEIKLDNIAMKGIVLELEQPINIGYFISSVDKTIEFDIKYNGSKRDLKYKLINAPDGIKFVSGYNILNEGYILYTPPTPESTITKYIRWEAPPSSEGKIYKITLEVTDGKLTKEISFDIKVATSRVLETDFDGKYLTIIDNDTDLKGVKIKFESDNQELPILRTVDAKYMEAPKNGIRVGSDYLFSNKNDYNRHSSPL